MHSSVAIVVSLLAGLAAGIAIHAQGNGDLAAAAGVLEPVGGIWLKALQMTVIPLLISLLVTGIASTHDVAVTGRLAGRALTWFAVVLTGSALLSALVVPLVLAAWPVDASSAQALLEGVRVDAAPPAAVPRWSEWFSNLVPSNPFQAAADGAIVPLVIFTLLFGLAVARLEPALRTPLLDFFRGVVAAMLLLVQWVLRVAPLGVFALALGVGMRGGLSAAGPIAQYLAIMCGIAILVTVLMYPVAAAFAGMPLRRFGAALAPAQAVAFSTQSSLASLPAMLAACQERLGLPPRVAGLVLPLAVSIFKATSPGVNLGVVLFIAHVNGVELHGLQVALGIVVAVVTSVGVAGIPGQVSFLTTTVPISAAMGVPADLLPLLLAVEVIPDIFRTVGNVTADVAVAAVVARVRDSGR